MVREKMHIKALAKGIDSNSLKQSMTVVLLDHVVDMMMEMQDDAQEAELKAKDDRIAELETKLERIQKITEDTKWDYMFRDFLAAALDNTLNDNYAPKKRI